MDTGLPADVVQFFQPPTVASNVSSTHFLCGTYQLEPNGHKHGDLLIGQLHHDTLAPHVRHS